MTNDPEPNLAARVEFMHNDIRTLVELMEQIPNGSYHQLLERLLQSTKAHFEFEEDIMRRCEFDDLDRHKAAHEELLKRLQEFTDIDRAHQVHRSREFVEEELTYWFNQHERGLDKDLLDRLKQRDQATPGTAS